MGVTITRVGLRAWIYLFVLGLGPNGSPNRDELQVGQYEAVAQPHSRFAEPAPHRSASVLWEAIDGNSTADPDKLRQFYMILMESMSGALGNEG